MNMKARVEKVEEAARGMNAEPPWFVVTFGSDKPSRAEVEAAKTVHKAQNPEWAKRPYNVIYTSE